MASTNCFSTTLIYNCLQTLHQRLILLLETNPLKCFGYSAYLLLSSYLYTLVFIIGDIIYIITFVQLVYWFIALYYTGAFWVIKVMLQFRYIVIHNFLNALGLILQYHKAGGRIHCVSKNLLDSNILCHPLKKRNQEQELKFTKCIGQNNMLQFVIMHFILQMVPKVNNIYNILNLEIFITADVSLAIGVWYAQYALMFSR